MRLVVTGLRGKIANALGGLATEEFQIIRLGRPAFDLMRPETLWPAIEAARPDILISAAAYTDVDRAESEECLAFRINAEAPGELASIATSLGVPIIHLSTDYVFSGHKVGYYTEEDATGPLGVYGLSKLAGEVAVAAAAANHAIVRTSWVYAGLGDSFVTTMLKLAQTRSEVAIVEDQRGCPTAAEDLANAIIAMAIRLCRDADPTLRGVFHVAGQGEASWAEFASAIFAGLARRGGPHVDVHPILSIQYPTAARRPANSRLATQRFFQRYGVYLPLWNNSLESCLDKMLVSEPPI